MGATPHRRMQLEETPVFREIEVKRAIARLPLVEVLTEHRRSFFTAVGLKLSEKRSPKKPSPMPTKISTIGVGLLMPRAAVAPITSARRFSFEDPRHGPQFFDDN